jgi:hypothetical protein
MYFIVMGKTWPSSRDKKKPVSRVNEFAGRAGWPALPQ